MPRNLDSSPNLRNTNVVSLPPPHAPPSPGALPEMYSINIYPAKVEQTGRSTKCNFLVEWKS